VSTTSDRNALGMPLSEIERFARQLIACVQMSFKSMYVVASFRRAPRDSPGSICAHCFCFVYMLTASRRRNEKKVVAGVCFYRIKNGSRRNNRVSAEQSPSICNNYTMFVGGMAVGWRTTDRLRRQNCVFPPVRAQFSHHKSGLS